MSDQQALELALNGESTKADLHRGFGIRTSRRMLTNGLSGNYFLLSGTAFLNGRPAFAETIEVFPGTLGIRWNGTYLGLRIPVSPDPAFRMTDYLE